MLEGDAAREAVASAARRTTSRRELGRNPDFEAVSPELGVLDEQAVDDLLDRDPDAALSLLVDLNGATDERLRELAHRLCARVVVELAGSRDARAPGVNRLEPAPLSRAEGDLDLDRSLDPIVAARRGAGAVAADELTVTSWRRSHTAICLLVDRSGSMAGDRLATAAVTAAAVLLRAGADCSVVAFSGEAVVLSSQGAPRPSGEVVVDLCRLRGGGVTDLALAMEAASAQLDRSRAPRRLTVLLSDCRATAGADVHRSIRTPGELVVLAPADDTVDAEEFARRVGCPWAPLAGPSSAPAALDEVLRGR